MGEKLPVLSCSRRPHRRRHASRRRLSSFCLWIAALSACAPLPAQAARVFVAALPARDDAEANATLTRALEAAVRSEAPGLDVVTAQSVRVRIDKAAMEALCDGEGSAVDCASELADAVDVDALLVPTFSRLDDQTQLTLALVSGDDAHVLAQGVRRARSDDRAQLLDEMPGLVREVLQAGGYRAALRQPKPFPIFATAALVAGVGIVGLSAAAHLVSFLVLEPGYREARWSAEQLGAWEFLRPAAFVLPVLGYLLGGGLVLAGGVGLVLE